MKRNWFRVDKEAHQILISIFHNMQPARACLVHCKIGFIRDAARRRNIISHALFKESCHESTTHNLLIKYDRLGGSDPRRAPPPLPQHLAYYVQGAVPVPPPHKYVILDSDVLQETDKEGEVSIKTACNKVLSFRRWLSVPSREYVGDLILGF